MTVQCAVHVWEVWDIQEDDQPRYQRHVCAKCGAVRPYAEGRYWLNRFVKGEPAGAEETT